MCEVFDFFGGQVTPPAGRQPGEADIPDPDAREAADRVADGGQHPPHLPVAALIDRQFDIRRPLPFRAFRRAEGAQDVGALRRGGHAVLQHHAAHQAAQIVGVGNAGDGGAIRFGDMVARVSQTVQKIAVVGQKNQPLAVGVEAAHWAQQGLSLEVYQVGDDMGGVDIGPGADDAARLVQGDVIPLVRLDDGTAIESDFISLRVNFRSQLGHDLAVHPHPALLNPHLACAPRPDAGGGEHFL